MISDRAPDFSLMRKYCLHRENYQVITLYFNSISRNYDYQIRQGFLIFMLYIIKF
jgi:hypothetical protein